LVSDGGLVHVRRIRGPLSPPPAVFCKQRQFGETVPETSRTVIIAHRPFALRASQVERAMRGVLPEPLRDHYVVVGQRRYPPKQVLGRVTGLDRADFTTHHARRILTGLGFPVGRRTHAAAPALPSRETPRRGGGKRRRPSAETLEPFVGQWVATRGAEVLVAAAEPREVVGWLAAHNQAADSMFRVPRDEFEASGVAPR
jgi:hypothetical protein